MNSYERHICSLKGTSLSSLEKYAEAIRCFDKALEIDPNDTNSWYKKGNALFELGKI